MFGLGHFEILLILVVLAIVIAIFNWLWNITLPQVFGLKKITFWQSFRILLLAWFLFGGGTLFNFNHQVSQQVQPSSTSINGGGMGQVPVPSSPPQEHKPSDVM